VYVQVASSPLFMLRAPAKVVRWLAAAFGAIAFTLAILTSPQHPDDCHSERGSTERGMFSMTQTASPTTFNPFNNCPGNRDFRLH
jgi:hypothetical protein